MGLRARFLSREADPLRLFENQGEGIELGEMHGLSKAHHLVLAWACADDADQGAIAVSYAALSRVMTSLISLLPDDHHGAYHALTKAVANALVDASVNEDDLVWYVWDR